MPAPNLHKKPAPPQSALRGALRIFTPANTILLILLLAGVTAAAVTQFSFSPANPAPSTTVATTSTSTSSSATSTTPATPAATPSTTRTGVSPPPPDILPDHPSLAQAKWEGIAQGSSLPLFQNTPAIPGLPPPAAGVRTPVNGMDLFTSKPVGFGAPTLSYKGYTVGFCCNQSAGYNGGFDGMSEAEKDTYVRSFLPK